MCNLRDNIYYDLVLEIRFLSDGEYYSIIAVPHDQLIPEEPNLEIIRYFIGASRPIELNDLIGFKAKNLSIMDYLDLTGKLASLPLLKEDKICEYFDNMESLQNYFGH